MPPEIDTTKPSIARVYDYFLGGKDNFAVDREAAEAALKIAPDARDVGMANRAFLRRAVHYMAAEAGIRQFLDIGSGLPTQGNVHEIAQAVDPSCRVVYVDNDPIVLVHGRALLATNDVTTVIQGDLRRPEEILRNPEVLKYIDFDKPLGLLLVAVLHHINDDEDPQGLADRFRSVLAPGSHMAIVHFFNPGEEAPERSRIALASEETFNKHLGTGRWRSREEIRAYFGDMELVEPGLVPLPDWRPEPDLPPYGPTCYNVLAGVGRVP
ncbi:SAM-dependent methyltransferase [Thermostaphylospora chromogena]|uniref:S-adenosyl methyltransferase n=1 Tax=Thermostaphylospora chromogena TaxID=35622 RepID=A0A1H1HF89_9ACTN|nr:SAM-dependent methyltransferase [Thermostaphylospora chromogena]SDR24087.1 S-adenosyl methyltransferase [Thermostaphylospora chromogena]